MSAIKTKGMIWPPRQVSGLYKRKPALKPRGSLTRANWTPKAKKQATEAWDETMRDFKHVDEPPGEDEWGAGGWRRMRSFFGRGWKWVYQGDCDDAVPRMMEKLLDKGFQRTDMRLLVGRTGATFHMVLGLEIVKNGREGTIIFDHRHPQKWWPYGEGPTAKGGDLKLTAASVPGAWWWTAVV